MKTAAEPRVSRWARFVALVRANPSGASMTLWAVGWILITAAVVLALPAGWRLVAGLASAGIAAVGAGGARLLILLWWHGFAAAAAAGRARAKQASQPLTDRKVSWR